jgi:hypothetical protein
MELRPTDARKVADRTARPTAPSAQAEAFYEEALRELARLDVPFLVGGTYALSAYTGISRATKDMDILCTRGDYPRILNHFRAGAYIVAIEDDRWLAKVFKGENFFDVIFASYHGIVPIDERWFEHAPWMEVLGVSVRVIAPTELIWSKAFVQMRHRYDGADIVHLILKQHVRVDWPRLLSYMDPHWEIFLAHLLNFRWAYPSERDHVPRWLMWELLERLRRQLDEPAPSAAICRGPLLSQLDYEAAVKEWGFTDATEAEERNGSR